MPHTYTHPPITKLHTPGCQRVWDNPVKKSFGWVIFHAKRKLSILFNRLHLHGYSQTARTSIYPTFFESLQTKWSFFSPDRTRIRLSISIWIFPILILRLGSWQSRAKALDPETNRKKERGKKSTPKILSFRPTSLRRSILHFLIANGRDRRKRKRCFYCVKLVAVPTCTSVALLMVERVVDNRTRRRKAGFLTEFWTKKRIYRIVR